MLSKSSRKVGKYHKRNTMSGRGKGGKGLGKHSGKRRAVDVSVEEREKTFGKLSDRDSDVDSESSDSERSESKKRTFQVKGNTFPFKDIIKEFGGKWDGKEKVWIVKSHLTSHEFMEMLKDEVEKMIEIVE